jgi:pimeloyl-ACP methyl ester carboxylesterase
VKKEMIRLRKLGISRFRSPEAKKEFLKYYDVAIKFLPRPKEVIDINTSFVRARVYRFGEEENEGKTPLVLIHGHYASSYMWFLNIPAFMKDRTVYAFDMIGEPSRSVQTRPFIKSKDQAFWLEEALEKLKLQKFHLLGASMGGWAATNYVRYYPKRVASLMLLDPVFVFTSITLETVKQFLVFQWNKEKMLSFLLNQDLDIDEVFMGKIVTTSMENFIFRTTVQRKIKKADLKKIRCPVLAIMAGESMLHNSEKAVKVGRETVRNIEIENWKGASHALNFEKDKLVNDRVLRFLQKLEENGK